MVRRAGLLCLCLAAGAEADFFGGLGSALGGMLEQAKEHAPFLAPAPEAAGAEAKNRSADVLAQAKETACSLKVKLGVAELNKTMAAELKERCGKAAGDAPKRADHKSTLAACMSSGLSVIEESLQSTSKNMGKDCLDAINEAPANFQQALAKWASKDQEKLQKELGPSIQSAIEEALKKAAKAQPEGKFELFASGEQSISARAPLAACTLLALPTLGLFFTLRRSRSTGFAAVDSEGGIGEPLE